MLPSAAGIGIPESASECLGRRRAYHVGDDVLAATARASFFACDIFSIISRGLPLYQRLHSIGPCTVSIMSVIKEARSVQE